MEKQRKRYKAELKAQIALEAIKGQHSINEIASSYGVHPNQVSKWKKQAQEGMVDVFSDRRMKAEQSDERLRSQLYEQIGQLKVELDWLKKKSGHLY